MARKIRTTSTFSLSFLDIMSCGLGAAVLIFLLLRYTIDGTSPIVEKQVLSEVSLLEEEIKEGEEQLVRIRNTISETSFESVTAQGLARKIEEDIKELKSLLEEIAPDAGQDIEGLKNKLARLESQKKALEQTAVGGTKAYEFTGDGQRQYLTGLRLGGENVLILLDSSASMLDESIVNIIRRRNMQDEVKRVAPKWQRALAITQWVIANLPLTSDFQVLTFNTDIQAAIGDELNEWHEVSDRKALEEAVQGIDRVIPEKGTNMASAFRVAMEMQPRPDNIFLITDGLPTQGEKKSNKNTVTGDERLRLFNRAMNLILPGIPINTLLLPLEGDTYAASAFWRMAIVSRGAFVTPARDWP
ncbi:MAG: VWA domain-containing protein [Gammaproteobacteria bacterium]|nr:VWA domain-containing protein [Gammaproteobacteria bacterium]